MKKNIFILTLIVIIGIFAFVSLSHKNEDSAENSTPTTTSTTTAKNYTLQDVATHKDSTSCWTAVNGKVYDVTEWINQHPGGADAILSLCGTDGSSAFNGQHGGQQRPETELRSFLIGTLAAQ